MNQSEEKKLVEERRRSQLSAMLEQALVEERRLSAMLEQALGVANENYWAAKKAREIIEQQPSDQNKVAEVPLPSLFDKVGTLILRLNETYAILDEIGRKL